MGGRRFLQVLVMLGGLIAWAVQFTVIYGVTSTLCARGWADVSVLGISVVPGTIVATTLATLLATAGILLYAFRGEERFATGSADVTDAFLNRATVLISALSLIVIVWHGLPAFILPACG